jgi:hypothetical protein
MMSRQGEDAMSQRLEIRSYDYVNHPYLRVRDALVADPPGVFRAATRAAAARAESVAAALQVSVAGLEVGTEIALTIGHIVEVDASGYASKITRVPVSWQAAKRPQLFPLMDGELSVYALTATETQLDFLGRYEPPLGLLGGAVNAVIGHRLAEASVHRLIADVAQYLRDRLTSA